ncbi:MAG: hypothetical protein M5U28_22110 [Sandaracinaceae bacterium]|nr:hypothetical protein [Sandaracinaceae bacterium]
MPLRSASLALALLAFAAPAEAQITIGPYSWPDATYFADTATHSGVPSWYGGATDATSALTGYSPTTAAVNVGYPCSDGPEIIELGFTDVVAGNGAGFDIVVFDARFSADHYEIAVRPVGGSFTAYRLYDSSTHRMTGVAGPAGATLWGIEVDLTDFGVPAGGAVDAIQIKGDCATNPGTQAELDPVMAAVVNAGCACDDGNECTLDACTGGTCASSPHAAGTACSAGVCDGASVCVECLESAHCPSERPLCDTSARTCEECLSDADCDDGNECTADACAAGACSAGAEPAGTLCSAGVCNGDASAPACVPCVLDAHCEDGNECTIDACVSGACASDVAPAGTECSLGVCDGDPVTPACIGCVSDAECGELTPFCVGGACVECGSDAQCDDSRECSADSCVDGSCVRTPLARGSACGGGVCDGDASAPECVECVSDTDCVRAAPRCSAQSRCVECLADAHCDDGDACTEDSCSVSGECSHEPAAACADAGMPDAGAGFGRTDGGCGCRAARPRAPAELAWLAGLVALVLARRRRRPQRPSTASRSVQERS